MFYEKNIDNVLRFGDVLRGYIAITPNIKNPILMLSALNEGYNIDINLPIFSVIISPSCSIGDDIISLTPLIKVRNTFFNNPYFKEDLTRINREMKPQLAVSSNVWNGLSPEEKERRLQEGKKGKGYAFLEIFIYEECDSFPKYKVDMRQGENIQTNYYMIDFRNTYKLSCDKIKSPGKAPLESKCLQLSLQTRAELRDKISYYYARVPKEDEVLED
jgi:hypothetical protein